MNRKKFLSCETNEFPEFPLPCFLDTAFVTLFIKSNKKKYDDYSINNNNDDLIIDSKFRWNKNTTFCSSFFSSPFVVWIKFWNHTRFTHNKQKKVKIEESNNKLQIIIKWSAKILCLYHPASRQFFMKVRGGTNGTFFCTWLVFGHFAIIFN